MSVVGGEDPELPADPTNAFVLASLLLRYWWERPGGFAITDLDDAGYTAWSDLVADVESRFKDGDGNVSTDDIHWLNSTRIRLADRHVWAHGVACGLDVATWQLFASFWHESIGSVASYTPPSGVLYPVGDWLPDPPAGLSRSVRPSAEGTHDDELPHLRRWSDPVSTGGGDPVSVEFRFDAEAEVRAGAEAAVASTIHANGSDAEFESMGTTSIFPVLPKPPDQGTRIVALVEACAAHRSGVVVGGEVSLTPSAVEDVQAWLDASWAAPALTVVGSMHTTVASENANVSFALRRRGGRSSIGRSSRFRVLPRCRDHPFVRGSCLGPGC